MEVSKMPNKDGTGPEGKGSRTGRQMGNCKDAKPAEKGLGPCGCGVRRGFRRKFLNNSSFNED
jgi:hypothetical protein